MKNVVKKVFLQLNKAEGIKIQLANISWMAGEKLFRMLIGLFIGIWVARYLGPEEFGLLSYSLSFFGVFLVFSSLGMDEIVVRNLVKSDKDFRSVILGTSFTLRLLGSFFVILIMYFTSELIHDNELITNYILIIGFSVFFKSFNVIDFYFQSKVESKFIAYSNIIGFLVTTISKVVFIVLKLPLIYFVWIILFETIIIDFGFVYFFQLKGNNVFDWKFSKKLAKEILHDSWPLLFSGFLITIYMKIDQVMIMNMLDESYVGQYAAAVRVSEAWYFIPLVISNSVFPAIINAKAKSLELYKDRLDKLYSILALSAYAISIAISFLGNDLIHILFGEDYFLTGQVLIIHIWASIFVFIGMVSNKQLLLENSQKVILFRAFIGVIINIGLNFILIPKMGIIGAALATLISQSISSYFIYALIPKYRFVFRQQTKALLFPVRFVMNQILKLQ